MMFLPALVQRQLALGNSLRESVSEGETSHEELLAGVLGGDRNWDEFYAETLGGFEIVDLKEAPQWLGSIALRERAAHELLWEGNYAEAGGAFAELADEAAERDPRLGAWFRHWEGAAYSHAGNKEWARSAFVEAANARSELGRPEAERRAAGDAGGGARESEQIRRIASVLAKNRGGIVKRLERVAARLKYGHKTGDAEEALRELGELLGLRATRPDKQEGTGPDVLWIEREKGSGAAIEAKTNKKESSQYRKKDDIGQYHDHLTYLKKRHPRIKCRQIIVGRILRVSDECNPPEELQIVEVGTMRELALRLRAVYRELVSASSRDELLDSAAWHMAMEGLIWPSCIESLQSRRAVDLQLEP